MNGVNDSLDDDDDVVPILVNLDQAVNDYNTTTIPVVMMEQSSQNSLFAGEEDELPIVPVTILTGFLGSGKTTLIQYILQSPDHGKKIAVIENEFSGASAASPGDISKLDGTLAEREGLRIETLIARDGSNNDSLTDLIELPNGCICCTVKDSLVETLECLVEKKRDLDYIIIECSGMANPGPIASIFWLDDALESRLCLDGVVTCVDAWNIETQLRETDSRGSDKHYMQGGDEAAQQIAYADRIIVNKIDLLEKKCTQEEVGDKLKKVLTKIRSINSTAPIRTTNFSVIEDLNWILDSNCFDAKRAQDVDAALKRSEFLELDGRVNFCVPCSPQTIGHTHTNAITTIALIEIGSVCLRRMNTWLASILWPDQDCADSILTAELKELERIGEITTPDLVQQKRKETIMEMKIFRVKGILSAHHLTHDDIEDDEIENIDDSGLDRRKFIVQAVYDLWEIKPTRSSQYWEPEDNRVCKLVLIGRNLDITVLRSGFQSCFFRKNSG